MNTLLRSIFISSIIIGVNGLILAGCGYAEITCGPGETCDCDGLGSCDAECVGGNCNMHCDGAGSCSFDCPEGGCLATCEGHGSCDLSCPGGDCTLECKGNGSCELLDCDESCELDCRISGSCSRGTSEPEDGTEDESTQ